MIKNCILCGSNLAWTSVGESFCPNHGIILENQEWDEPYDPKEEEEEEK